MALMVGFLSGILGASYPKAVLAGILLMFFWKRGFSFKFLLLIFCGFLLGVLRVLLATEFATNDLNYEGTVILRGCIEAEVDVRDDKVKYTLNVESLKNDGEWLDARGKILVYADRYPVYEYGECLMAEGEITEPGVFEDFDYGKYLSRYGIAKVMYRAKIMKIEGSGGLRIFRMIYSLKRDFSLRLERAFPEPAASFLAGLVLGSRRGISAHLMEDFNITGLTHIIAISGYNITLVILIVSAFFAFLNKRLKVVVATIFIIFFVILVGAGSAVVRAAIMGIIGLTALWFERQYSVSVALFAAAFFMNIWNPQILIYDVGFQLSFLATCGLVYVSPFLEKHFLFLPKFLAIRESVLMTVSAQILALPVIIMNFGRLSLISPLANLCVLPFIPLAMIFGFLAVAFSYIWNPLSVFFGFIAYLILKFMVILVQFFASFTFASIDIEWFPWWLMLLYYFFVLRWIIKKHDWTF